MEQSPEKTGAKQRADHARESREGQSANLEAQILNRKAYKARLDPHQTVSRDVS
jgi:hypothetical protein